MYICVCAGSMLHGTLPEQGLGLYKSHGSCTNNQEPEILVLVYLIAVVASD